MAAPLFLSNLAGTRLGAFIIGALGVRLKNNSGDLVVRNNADSADAQVTASQFNASGNIGIVFNSDAAGSGADWSITIQRAAAGMTANYTLTLPPDDGSPGQVMTTDGAGVLTWQTPGTGNTNGVLQDDTALVFGSTSPVTMFTTPASSEVTEIEINVTAAFTGGTGATVSIGKTGSLSEYVGTGDVDLGTVGIYKVTPGLGVIGAEALIATYSSGGATAGAATMSVRYVVPS